MQTEINYKQLGKRIVEKRKEKNLLQKDFAEKEELIQLIENRFPGGQPEVERAISIIIAQGGLEEATAYAEGYLKQAEVYIEQLPIHSTKKLLLDGVDYLRGRAF